MKKPLTPEELEIGERLQRIVNDPWVKKMMGKSHARKKARPVGKKKGRRR